MARPTLRATGNQCGARLRDCATYRSQPDQAGEGAPSGGMAKHHDAGGGPWHAHRVSARRTEWLQADLRCLMCGRVIGHLVGPLPLVKAPGVPSQRPVRFTAFRPADSSAPALRLIGGERFRCTSRSGPVMMDQVETISMYAES